MSNDSLIQKLENAKIHLGAVNGDFVGDDEEWHNKGIDRAITIIRQHTPAPDVETIKRSMRINAAMGDASTRKDEEPSNERQRFATSPNCPGEISDDLREAVKEPPYKCRHTFEKWAWDVYQIHLRWPYQGEWVDKCDGFFGAWDIRFPKPVSVSLEKCATAAMNEAQRGSDSPVDYGDAEAIAKAILDAAGVKYVD